MEVFQTHCASCFKIQMKHLTSVGLGKQHKQAKPINEDEAHILWTNGVLGDNEPKTLSFLGGINPPLQKKKTEWRGRKFTLDNNYCTVVFKMNLVSHQEFEHGTEDLVHVYCSLITSVVEYARVQTFRAISPTPWRRFKGALLQ